MVTAKTYHMRQCWCIVTFNADALLSRFPGKETCSSIEKFPSLVLPGNTTTVTAPNFPISSLLSVSGHLWEFKNKWKFQTFSSKVVAVAFKRWSLTRGFQCSDFAEKLLLFWKTGRWGEVVATGCLTEIFI